MQSSVSGLTKSLEVPDSQTIGTFEIEVQSTKNIVELHKTFNPLPVVSIVRRLNQSRAFPIDWWKGPSAFIADIADERFTFNLATKEKNGANWTNADQS